LVNDDIIERLQGVGGSLYDCDKGEFVGEERAVGAGEGVG
jgi:hypothetical protein